VSKLAITQVKSGIGSPKKIRRTLEALGLRHQRTVLKPDHPAIRGMLFRVRHLVQVAPAHEAAGAAKPSAARRTAAKKSARSGAKTTKRPKAS
jgi:large subunit ribosomal protein L30